MEKEKEERGKEVMSMRNAKDELFKHLIDKSPVKWIEIEFKTGYGENEKKIFEGDFNDVIDGLDFEYDASFGLQWLYGTIWYEDGTWSKRKEYDGSEWWEHHKCPSLPNGYYKREN